MLRARLDLLSKPLHQLLAAARGSLPRARQRPTSARSTSTVERDHAGLFNLRDPLPAGVAERTPRSADLLDRLAGGRVQLCRIFRLYAFAE